MSLSVGEEAASSAELPPKMTLIDETEAPVLTKRAPPFPWPLVAPVVAALLEPPSPRLAVLPLNVHVESESDPARMIPPDEALARLP